MKRCLGLLLMVSVTACAARAADPRPEADRLQLADGLYAREMYELAAAEYASFLQSFPTNTQAEVATYRLGECYRSLSRYPDADQQFKRVIDDYPQGPYRFRAGFRRADIYLATGKPKAGLMLYQELLAANPPPDIASAGLFFLADAALQVNERATAEAALERIRKEFPGTTYFSYALLRLGALRSEAAMTSPGDEMIALYTQALSNAPSDRVAAEALFQLGEARYDRREFDQSAALYTRLISTYPQDARVPRARLRGAWAAHNAGLYSDALRLVGDALPGATADGREDWLYLKANCERQLVHDTEALQSYAALLQEFPKGRTAEAARLEQALTLYRMGRHADAVAAARAVTLAPENRKDVYWLLAESFTALKRDDEAIQYYRLIATDFPQSDVAADATYRLGFHLQERGDHAEAAGFFERLAASSPTNRLAPQALFAAGLSRSESKQPTDAIRNWAKLIEAYPGDPRVEEAFYRKALAEVGLDRKEEALRSLRTLLTTFPNSSFSADAHFWQGVLLRESGDLPNAEKQLRLALDAHPREELALDCELQLALILHKRGSFEEAAKRLQPLLDGPARTQMTPSLLQWLSEYEFSKNQLEQSAAAARALVAVSTNAVGKQIGWGLLGRAHTALKQGDEAEKAFTRALACEARTPFAAESALRLGELELSRGNAAQAVPHFEQAASLANDDPQAAVRAHAYAGLGRAAKNRGDAEAASRFFMSVAVLYDDRELVPESLYEAASAMNQLGRTNESRRTVQELRERYPDSPWVARGENLADGAAPEGTTP